MNSINRSPARGPRAAVAAHADRNGENMGGCVLPSTVAVVARKKVSLDRREQHWGLGNERGDVQGGLLADLHLGDALIPA